MKQLTAEKEAVISFQQRKLYNHWSIIYKDLFLYTVEENRSEIVYLFFLFGHVMHEQCDKPFKVLTMLYKQ